MHELALSHQICRVARDHVPDGQRLVAIVVECGPMSGVVPEALEHCFPIAAEDAGLHGARLELVRLKASAVCPGCGRAIEIDSMWDPCPACGYAPLTVHDGRDLRVVEIEVEGSTDV
jgi:hydrogenase nickel incorporation protein HypA/HybF